MATAVEPNPTPATTKYDPILEAQLAQATRRIRINDVFTGVLVLVAIVLGYIAAMIAVDRFVDLPAWARQAGLLGLCAVLLTVGYYVVVRPLRRMVNPLFAAKQVEETVPDAKNSIVNYVDLHDRPLPDSIREAVGARAVKQLEAADLNEATNSRGLIRAGATVALLVVILAALFLTFRPSQFLSLLSRTLTPFSAGAIATRTEIILHEPAGGDVTVTAGQPVVVAISVNGRVPHPNEPNRLRVLLRYNPADPNPEVVPLEPAGSNRDWRVQIPNSLVQNGFWYRIVGGDASTPEYRVQVRSRPLFTGYEVRYEYPEYLRLLPEVVPSPQIQAYRGTQITLTARTNRELVSGKMVINGKEPGIPGVVVGDNRDTLRFTFTVMEAGSYRLAFKATSGETNADVSQIPINLYIDQPPVVTISAPTEEEISLPANGQLKVDAIIGDDFGIDTVTLQMRLANGERKLASKPYQDGKSFRRESDGTYPTRLEYKDSVSLGTLKDESNEPIELHEGMILEYWLEATDNCTVPQANVGRSKVRRVRITAPIAEPKQQEEQQQQAAERQQAEAQHQQQQQQQFDTERRDPPPQPRPDAVEQPKEPQKGEPGDQQPEPKERSGEPGDTSQGQPQPQPSTSPDTKPSDTPEGTPRPEPTPGGTQPSDKPAEKPMAGDSTTQQEPAAGTPETKTTPQSSPEQSPQPTPADSQSDPDQLKQEAQRIQEELRKQDQLSGEARENRESTSAAESKETPSAKTGSPPDKTADPAQARTEEQPGTPKPAGRPDARPDSPESQPQTSTGERKPGPDMPPDAAAETKPATESSQPSGSKGDPAATPKPDPKDPEKLSPEYAKPDPGGSPEDVERLFREAQKLNSDDPAERQKAEQELDQAIGKEAREELQKKMQDAARSGDPKQQEAAREQIEEMTKKKKPDQPPGTEKGTTKPSTPTGRPDTPQPQDGTSSAQQQPRVDPQEMEQAIKDLGSGDPERQQAARDKLDQMVGPQAREQAEQLMNDLKSDDPARQAAAQQKLQDLQHQAQQTGQPQPKREPTAEERKQLEQAANDLMSDDPQKQQAARDKLDQMIGEDARKQAEQLANDLKSDDPQKRAAAQKQLQDLQQQAQQNAGQPQPKRDLTPEEKKELTEAAKDLASDDPEKKQAARDKLDEMVGKEARQEAEKLAEDLKSDDPARQAAAQQKLQDLQQQAQQTGQPQPKREPTAEERKQLEQAANDLMSDDPQKQQAARDKLDEMVGPEARQQAEQLANDLKSGDPQKASEAMKKLQDFAERMKNRMPPRGDGSQPEAIGRGMGGSPDTPSKPLEANEDFSRMTAEMQLEQFKKIKDDPELLKRLGYTPQDYERFLKGFEEMVRQERAQQDQQPRRDPAPPPTGPTVNVGEARKVEHRKDGSTGTAQGTGPAYAPPGYSEAQKRFAEQLRAKEKEKK
jgi:collagen type III alpha